MSPAIHDLMPFFLLLVSLGVALVGWIVRDAMKRIDALMIQGAAHATQIALLAESNLRERVEDHEARLRALEVGIFEMRSDIKIIRQMLENSAGTKPGGLS